MFKTTTITGAILALAATTAVAQEVQDTQKLERIEVTGSSIKRIAGEAALPVQTISSAEIAKSGVTSVTDLIQNLPAMQGFTTSSMSVNGGGAGATTASLHDVGASYTLVLLNGRRLAPLNTGSTVNLNAIPLSAIERVEVLTDGASALYGSDAIAGVVNFITKKDSTNGEFNVSAYKPQHPGGGSSTMSISKGFGDLEKDKFNILFAAGFDNQQALFASQRDFSKTGNLTFMDQGQLQNIPLLSSNSVPANVSNVLLSDGSQYKKKFNPHLLASGSCPADQVKSGNYCKYDYSATVEDLPASTRASLFTSGRLVVSDKVSLFTELALSNFQNRPVYAAPAQQNYLIPASLLAADINPYLAQLGHPGVTAVAGNSTLMNMRLFDAGGRTDVYTTNTLHFVAGVDATLGNWDTTATYTHSVNKFSDKADGGYVDKIGFDQLVSSGAWDPLMSVKGAGVNSLRPLVLHQVIDQSESSIDVVSVRGSTSLGKLPGGDIGLGIGADYTLQKYKDNPSAILQGQNALQPNYADAIVGGGGGALPFDSSRNAFGLFTELVLPVTKSLEFTGSARYDSYTAIKNNDNFDTNGNPVAAATQGKTNSSATYKLSLRFQPTKDLLFRASVGTGFKAPSMANVTSPLQSGGVTGMHACPTNLPAAVEAYCQGTMEYNILAGGNPQTGAAALKPEKSQQATLGFRFEPTDSISVGADFWLVRLKDQINTVTDNTAFPANGITAYPQLFTVAPDPVSHAPVLNFLSLPINTGKANYQGIDFDATGRMNTPVGRLTTHFAGTYMLKADYQSPGVPGYQTSMSQVGPDGQVTFRYQLRLSATLDTGAFSNTATLNFKPGYMDDTTDYCRADPADPTGNTCLMTADGKYQIGRHVGSYMLVDWQTKYALNKSVSITGGIKNLFDRKPPFSVVDQLNAGNARGFDGRYTDPIGRQFYLGANVKF
ncbi:TonB-dependent receptor plug domain-containing protein [Roseateles saccharophilus]|uniref:Iron complex outermembrane receptor protein n=1 Tax=Roseateles saccharophilus TaxID=304 RepID=A0A4V2VSS2_ROSSA|nr:TonB-dependent receptor [Roseateles saccharophilus]MDG0832110.1 TonB-dependent receptor [Roseateles saccharophilus]TCV03520.1 iron complex outermembrane receptor protein [Roseateles saccharophilus]